MPPGGYTANTGMFPDGRLDIYPARASCSKWSWRGSTGRASGRAGDSRRPSRDRNDAASVWPIPWDTGASGPDGSSQAKVAISSDGSATIFSAAQELGQGINTALCMLTAESLGIPLDDVAIFTGDTRNGVFDLVAARSSHQLATVGHMMLKAVENAKQQLRERAAPRWEIHPDQVEISGKKAFPKDHPDQAIPLSTCSPPLIQR